MKNIIKNEHYRRTEERVDHADKHKAYKGFVGEFCDKLFHKYISGRRVDIYGLLPRQRRDSARSISQVTSC